MSIERKLTWFDSPEEAEEAVRQHYRQMTPKQRMDEMVELLNRWGKWNERRLERIYQVIDVP
jgi:hypothetical protein